MKRRLLRVIVPAYPQFNPYAKTAKTTTSLGPILVATATSHVPGWDVEVIDENNYSKKRDGYIGHTDLKNKQAADIAVFFGTFSSTIPRVYELAELYKHFGAITVAGGHHIKTNLNEPLYNSIDIAIAGDGAETLIEIMKAYDQICSDISFDEGAGQQVGETALQAAKYSRAEAEHSSGTGRLNYPEFMAHYWKNIKGIAFNDEFGFYMTAPQPSETDCQSKKKLQILPDFGLLKHAKMEVYPIQWQAGCTKHCEYCAVQKRPTKNKVEDLFALVAHAHEEFGAKKFFIVDDCFGGDMNDEKNRTETLRTLKILAEYNESTDRELSFSVQTDLAASKDQLFAISLQDAGINEIRLCYELPPDTEIRDKIKRVLNATERMIGLTQIWRIVHGFKVHGMFMLGYPNKNSIKSDLDEQTVWMKRFIRLCQFDSIDVSLAVPIPGTDLRNRLREENRLFPLDIIGWEYYDGKHPLYLPADCTPEELYQALQEIWFDFYGKNLHTIKHQAEFLKKLKRAQQALAKS